ncbi:hypothetical protein ABLE92_24430 [Gordonia sp. VNQ95]|uniref:hypothetical protein n=1 Tax=Gordonia sp. VNQ95 TaxID=3156619 RepID=UPI0032B3580D
MIPNTHPCYDRSLRDVVAWSDEGRGLVIDYKTGRLVEAIGPLTSEADKPSQLIPGHGWEVIYKAGNRDEEWREPLVAWGVTNDGVVPLATDANGLVEVVGDALIVPSSIADTLGIPHPSIPDRKETR